MKKEDATVEAQKQWNTNPCGEVEGEKNSIDYFKNVEKARYSQQKWQKDYFKFDDFGGKKILEIGIGHGTDLIQFAKSGAICYGVDITDKHLELTQANFNLQKLDVTLYKSDASQMPFEDSYFDCIYSFGVIHHIPDAENVIKECFRILKPGGKIMLAFYYKYSAFSILIKFLNHGLVNGWLFKMGFKGLLSTIEFGADGVNIKPFVKLYSKKDMRRLLGDFQIDDISIHQIEESHFWPNWLNKLSRSRLSDLESRFGWYIACKAEKI
jgi:ubiquinone/menaquinone biosynthesis C-methylase UbiE